MIGVETLIAIAGQLINLVRARKVHKEDEFSTFVKPLYDETEKVIGNYLQLFQNAIESIRNGQDSTKILIGAWGEIDLIIKNKAFAPETDFRTRMQIAEKYEKDRQPLLYARIKLQELATVYWKSDLNDEIKDFARSIVNVFTVTTSTVSELFTTITRTGDVSARLRDDSIEPDLLLIYVEQMEREIRKHWAFATNRYAKLLIESRQLR